VRGAPLLATVALVPLILTPHLLYYYDVTPKLTALLLGVALALMLVRIDPRSLWTGRLTRWFVCIVAFQWAWFGLATALSTNPAISLNGSTWRRSGFITETAILVFAMLCLAWLLENAANIRLLLRVVSAVGVLISVYTIAQYFGIDPLLTPASYQAGEAPFTIVRPPGTMGHADYLGAWLLFAMFCSPIWTLPLTAFALLLTGTRSALVGLGAGAVVLLLLRRVGTIRSRFSAAGFAAILVMFVLSPAGAKIRARIQWSLDDPRGGARLLLWRDTLGILRHHPVAGLGPETFGTQFPLSESVELARAYPDFYHESPHNLLLDLAAGQGLPAALALLGLASLACYAGIGSKSELAPRLMAGLAALFVAQLFVVFTIPNELAFYLMPVMLISLAADSAPSEFASARQFIVLRYAVATLLVVCAIRYVATDYWFTRADQDIAAEDVAGASNAYQASLWWQPAGAGSDLLYSREMATLATRSTNFKSRLDAFDQAFQSGVRATQDSEQRQNAWYNLAELFASRNDVAGTERSLRNAIAWSPNWFKPHWVLAKLLQAQQRRQEALFEAQAAVERDGGRDSEVSETLNRLQTSPPSH
jgi:O-antigen ligase